MGQRLNDYLAKVMPEVKELTVSDLNAKTIGQDIVLVDVRDPDEWARGVIPNAVCISRGTLEVKIEQVFPDLKTPLLLQCGGGTRSAFAAKALQDMGYEEVYSLKGGFRDWVASGGDIEMIA